MRAAFTNPVLAGAPGKDHGDPFVLRHLDEYFLYHTTDDGDSPISVLRSSNLVDWDFLGFALEGGGEGHWAQTDLWAPEVMYLDGVFYMYVAGTVLGEDGEGIEARRRQGLARSASPVGPFVLDDAPLVPDVWSIDGHPFQDEDGSLWLFYNVRTEATRYEGKPGSGTVVDRLLAPDRLEGRPTPVAFPSAPWEGTFAGDAYWNEGSWVLKRRGFYHQLFSAGFYRDSSYGIGLASARRPRGPWRKDPANPIFRSGRRITGPGHHCVILAPDGVTPYAVYHGYLDGEPGRKVNLDPAPWCGDRPVIGPGPVTGRPTEAAQPRPASPVYDPAVPWWHADMWVTGQELQIGGVAVALGGRAHPRRVRANQGAQGLRVWVDGALRHEVDGEHPPRFTADGAIVSHSLTSHLSDERVHELAPGERVEWRWGGAGPVEITLAVSGACQLQAGALRERGLSPDGRFTLLQADVERDVDTIVVIGEAPGTRITDLFVAARE